MSADHGVRWDFHLNLIASLIDAAEAAGKAGNPAGARKRLATITRDLASIRSEPKGEEDASFRQLADAFAASLSELLLPKPFEPLLQGMLWRDGATVWSRHSAAYLRLEQKLGAELALSEAGLVDLERRFRHTPRVATMSAILDHLEGMLERRRKLAPDIDAQRVEQDIGAVLHRLSRAVPPSALAYILHLAGKDGFGLDLLTDDWRVSGLETWDGSEDELQVLFRPKVQAAYARWRKTRIEAAKTDEVDRARTAEQQERDAKEAEVAARLAERRRKEEAKAARRADEDRRYVNEELSTEELRRHHDRLGLRARLRWHTDATQRALQEAGLDASLVHRAESRAVDRLLSAGFRANNYRNDVAFRWLAEEVMGIYGRDVSSILGVDEAS